MCEECARTEARAADYCHAAALEVEYAARTALAKVWKQVHMELCDLLDRGDDVVATNTVLRMMAPRAEAIRQAFENAGLNTRE